MSSITRQPTQLDYASPTQFKFGIAQLPKVEFFTTAANLPGITMVDAVFPTPFKDIPVMGEKLTYENLEITFIVDEFLENYKELAFIGAGRAEHTLFVLHSPGVDIKLGFRKSDKKK